MGKGEMGSREEHHDIVIAGGGICGLATALALHRKGIKSLVLERSDVLRASGAAIDIYNNGWLALDQLGIGADLRKKAVPISEVQVVWLEQNRVEVAPCSGEPMRSLKRSDLIETLARDIPKESIRLGCQIIALEQDPITSFPTLYTDDGATIKAKILIGCDGLYSVIAKSLGLRAPKAFPMFVARGFTYYPNGHGFENNFIRMMGYGAAVGRIPVNEKLVYLFVCGQYQTPLGSDVLKDPELIKEYLLGLIKEFPPEMVEVVKHCDITTLGLTQLRYRAPWHLLFANFWQGTTTVAGDAMHVMSPFLGQGGCSSLEDAVVLARCLAQEVPRGTAAVISDRELGRRVGRAFGRYVDERRLRLLRLSCQSYLIGLMTSETTSWMKKMICVAIVVAFLGGNSLDHASYDCGAL